MKGSGKLPVNYMLSTKLQTDAVEHDHQPLEMKLEELEVWSLDDCPCLQGLLCSHWSLTGFSGICLSAVYESR